MSWIYTYTGRKIDLFAPRAEDIDVNDIAHALAQINRWGGHATFPYSVAQHSVAVSKLCDPDSAMAGLFHDAAEAYFGDICRPLKRSATMAPYRDAYEQMERVIMYKFTGDFMIPASVKRADEEALKREAAVLMPGHELTDDEWLVEYPGEARDYRIQHVPFEYRKQGFLLRFYRLSGLISHSKS